MLAREGTRLLIVYLILYVLLSGVMNEVSNTSLSFGRPFKSCYTENL